MATSKDVKVYSPKIRGAFEKFQQELAKEGIRIVDMPKVKVKRASRSTKPVSVQSVVQGINTQLREYGYAIQGTPTFAPQGNFTLCQVHVTKIGRGRQRIIVGTGVAKRNNLDQQNVSYGQVSALQRAVFGEHTDQCRATTKEEKGQCNCLLQYPTSVLAKIKAAQQPVEV